MTNHIRYIIENSKKDLEWIKEATERLETREDSGKSGFIATQLAIYMVQNGIDYAEFVKKTGITLNRITKIMNGRKNLTFADIEKIENGLEIPLITVENLEKS